jgi:hypothetical protein
MTMSYQRADTTLNALLQNGTPHVWLHTGSPGENGTSNVAQTSVPANIVRKAATFGAAANHATNTERESKTITSAIEWTGAQIAASQEITHFSIWDASTSGNLLFLSAVTTPKTTGSDGVTIAIGDLAVAISVFVKPA